EIQRLVNQMHVAVVVLHVLVLSLLQDLLDAFLAEELDQGLIFWKCAVSPKQIESAFFCIAFADEFLGLGQKSSGKLPLKAYKIVDLWLELVELVTVSLRNGT